MKANPIVDAKAQLGEGAIWNSIDKLLYWVDILSGCVHVYNPATSEDKIYKTGKMVGTVVQAGAHTVLLALQDGIATLDLSNGAIDYKLATDIHFNNMRFNDGKCDPQGRFWVGSLSLGDASDNNKLYCVNPNFDFVEKMNGLTISNGIAWSPDGNMMYHIDTPTGEVTVHNFDQQTGNISNRQVIITIPAEEGYPDGMTVDSDGMLWIALWDGFGVAQYNPNTGRRIQKISVPVPKVTSCAFGGKDLTQLYITTASCEMSKTELIEFPLSGALFMANVNAQGLAASKFHME